MDILTFIAQNPWQTFFLGPFVFVMEMLAAWVIGNVLNFLFRVLNRILRTIKVCVRGWPPKHLDADGDFKPINVDEESVA